jgi:hypothetical protein
MSRQFHWLTFTVGDETGTHTGHQKHKLRDTNKMIRSVVISIKSKAVADTFVLGSQ